MGGGSPRHPRPCEGPTAHWITGSLPRHRFVSFSEALSVNSAATYLVGILVLLATLQLWHLLHHEARLQVISRTLSKAWDEVTGFLLIILVLLTGYAMAVSPVLCLVCRVAPTRKGARGNSGCFESDLTSRVCTRPVSPYLKNRDRI